LIDFIFALQLDRNLNGILLQRYSCTTTESGSLRHGVDHSKHIQLIMKLPEQ